MPKLIIADTSCLLVLTNLNELELLEKIYSEIYITDEIAFEYEYPLPKWILIKQVVNRTVQQTLELQVDNGEASAFALALENEESVLIIDDLKARKLALKLKLNFTGTIGVIIKAKQMGIINAVKPLLLKIRTSDFRISDSLINEALKLTNED